MALPTPNFNNETGTSSSTFQIGSASTAIQGAADKMTVLMPDGVAKAPLEVAKATGSNNDAATTWMNVRDASPLILFSFDGASAPAAGTNTGKHGLCHTTGTTFTAGQIYWDDGATLTAIKQFVGQLITSSSTVTGTVSMIQNGTYAVTAATAPYSYVLKGDGGSTHTGAPIWASVAITTAASASTTVEVPNGAIVLQSRTVISTGYDTGTTISVTVAGSTPQAIQTVAPASSAVIGSYSAMQTTPITADSTGVVTVTIDNTPAAGAGTVYVQWAATMQA